MNFFYMATRGKNAPQKQAHRVPIPNSNEKETHTHKEWRLAKERPKCRREGGDAAYTLTIRPGNEGRQEVSDLFFTRVLTRLLRGGGGGVNPGTEDRPATAPCDGITDWRERGGTRTERKGLGKANSWGGGGGASGTNIPLSDQGQCFGSAFMELGSGYSQKSQSGSKLFLNTL